MNRWILLCASIHVGAVSLSAQVRPMGPDAAMRYLRARADSGAFSVSVARVASGLASGGRPVIVDVRNAAAYARQHVNGSVSVPLADLARTESLQKLRTGGPIVVVDNGDDSAIEAMVLLRLWGFDARAMTGDVAGLFPPAPSNVRPPVATPTPAKPEPSGVPTDAPRPSPPLEKPSTPDVVASPAATPPAASLTSFKEFWFAIAGVLALLAATLAYFLAVQPWLRAKPLREAKSLLTAPTPDLEAIEALLARAVTAGLKKDDLAEARFLLAYVRARQGRYADASAVLSDLVESGDTSRETAYLDLWLHVVEKRWEKARQSYEQHADILKGYLGANRLAGIAYLEIGRQCLTQREVDRGLNCFERLRQLGEFTDEIPKDMDDNEMVVAIEALFEDKFDLAHERFASAKTRAEERKTSTLHARIGLIVCEWRRQAIPDVDEDLDLVVREVLAALPARDAGEESVQFARHVLLWHLVSRLHKWFALPPKKGLPSEERQRLADRLAALRKLHPDSSDANLIEGLVGYFFAADDDEQARAIALLRAAVKGEARVPEVLFLLDCENRLAQVREKRLDNYLLLLKSYLTDSSVPIDLRRELRDYLIQFPPFGVLGDVDVSGDSVAQTVQELQSTSETVERLVRNMFRGSGASEGRAPTTAIDALLNQMRDTREAISQATGDLSSVQQKLMRVAGEALLPEDPTVSESPPPSEE